MSPDPERGDTPGRVTEGDAETISGQQIKSNCSSHYEAPVGLCWLACGVSHCACCPLLGGAS